jgi:adhesin transport system membrane fusion protein
MSLLARFRKHWQGLSDQWAADEELDTLDWLEDADRALIEQEPLRARMLLYVALVTVLLLLVWAAIAEIDQVTRGEGKVIPSRQIQVIQSLDGGVVTEIVVQEGDLVEAGQLLVRLDETRFVSTLRENRSELMALQVKAERLRAITEGRPFRLSEELTASIPLIARQEQTLYTSSLEELESAKNTALQQVTQREQELEEATARRNQMAQTLALASREMVLTRPLVASGAVSEVELLRLERDVANFKGERDQAAAQIRRLTSAVEESNSNIREVELEFINRQREMLSEVTARINSLEETGLGLSDRVNLTAVRSPVRGTVNRLFINTIGGVVLPGKEVVEIVPLDDNLLLEARIRPKDIGFLRPGQQALVKFTAYDFVVYGGLDAVVDHIGADTVMDEEGNPFYTIRVRTLEANLGIDMPIIPGMVAEVDILTGKKTILNYLLKPVLRAKQYALSER